MRNLRQLCAAVVLTLVVTAHTFAGDMHTLAIDPPPPPPAETEGQMDTTVEGQIHTTSSDTDPISDVALGLLQGVLSLL